MCDAVMIFAAGFGTRMKPLTDTKPKPLIKVDGITLLDRALAMSRSVHDGPIMVNAHYLANQITQHLEGQPGVLVFEERPRILDTGGGLKNALHANGSKTVATMNPDVVWAGENPLQLAMQSFDPDHMDALMICVSPERAVGRVGSGDFDLDDACTVSRGSNVIYGGIHIIKSDIVRAWPDKVFSLNAIWDDLIAKGRCKGVEYPGQWCDVGRPEGIQMAKDMLARFSE